MNYFEISQLKAGTKIWYRENKRSRKAEERRGVILRVVHHGAYYVDLIDDTPNEKGVSTGKLITIPVHMLYVWRLESATEQELLTHSVDKVRQIGLLRLGHGESE